MIFERNFLVKEMLFQLISLPLNVIWHFCFTDFNILFLICTCGFLVIICCKEILSWSDSIRNKDRLYLHIHDFLKIWGNFWCISLNRFNILFAFSFPSSGISVSQKFGLIMVSQWSYVSEICFLVILFSLFLGENMIT